MLKQIVTLIIMLLVGFVGGWYSHTCPAPVPCPPVVQVQPQTVTTEVAKPALDATEKYSDKEKQLSATIADLRAKAAATPKTVTVVKEVPAECKQYMPTAQQDCLDAADLELLRAAQRATTGE